MKKLIYIFFFASVSFLLLRCSDIEKWGDPVDDIPPGNVSNPIVENLPGSVRITYSLPSDDDLLGVKAVYSYSENGETLEAFASAFSDTLELDGFPDTNERTVQLICLDKSKNESAPVEVGIQPLTPPVELIGESLKFKETFGGVYASWVNEYKADIGISLYAADSTGEMVHNYTYYTNEPKGNYSFRGFDNTERKFQIQIRDKWDRYSALLDTVLKPRFEIQINGFDQETGAQVWTRYGANDGTWEWRGDYNPVINQPNLPFTNIFNKSYGFGSFYSSFWHSGAPGNMLIYYTGEDEDKSTHLYPMYFIIDLGREVVLSRHKKWDRAARVNAPNNIRSYEIWATNNPPKGPDDFNDKWESLEYWTEWSEVGGTGEWKNDWVKIATCECIPPSGATQAGAVTEEDNQWALANGYEFDIDPEYNSETFRYLRIRSDKNWAGGSIIHIGEFELWGSYVD